MPGVNISPFGRGWDIHFGRVTHNASQLCAAATAQTMNLELPDGSRQTLHKSNGVAGTSGTDYLTTNFWKAQCHAGGGIVVFAPNGTKYEMTEVDGAFWHAKRITDRFGNYFDLTYEVSAAFGRKVVKTVTANDGRSLTFSYASGKLTTVAGGGVSWQYSFQPGADGSHQLSQVTPPAGGNWTYSYFGNRGTAAGSHAIQQVTNPFGGRISYDFVYVTFLPGIVGYAPSTAVSQKTAEGDQWSYAYSPGCPGSSHDTTTVTLPDGIGQVVYKHFGYCTVGAGDVWKIGLLYQKTTGAVQTETLTWTPQVISLEDAIRPGYNKFDTEVNRALLAQRVVSRDGGSFSTTFSSFDAFGNPQSISESGNRSRSKSVTYFNNTTSWIVGVVDDETIPGVGTIQRSIGSAGEVLSENRYGVITTFNYHGDGAVSSITNDKPATTSFSGYLRGVAQTENRPEGVTISRSVNGLGHVTSQSDGEFTWGYGRDAIGRLTSVDYPIGTDASVSWPTNKVRTINRPPLLETTEFDLFGNVERVTRAGVPRTFNYDALGRRIFESMPDSASGTSTSYDILGRVKQVQSPAGIRNVSYAGSSVTVTDERSKSTRFDYDRYGDPDEGFLTGITPLGDTAAAITMTRNAIGILDSASQGGVTRSYGYNKFFLTSITEPEAGTTAFGRDGVGNMSSKSVGGTTVTFTHDGLNRLRTISGSGASVTLGYNNRSKVTSVVNGAATRSYTYDANGNLKEDRLVLDGLTFVVGYDYDGLDGLASITYPQSRGTVTFTPDSLGRPTRASPYLTSVQYRPSGNLSSITFGNGITQSHGEHSTRQLPTSISAAGILNLTYAYDNAGNVQSLTSDTEIRTFDYDGINRLTTTNGPWGNGLVTYDGAGNIRSKTFGGYSINLNYTSNRLSSVTGSVSRTYSYDGAGNATNGGQFAYDVLSQMTCANCAGPNRADYAYDGQGRRVRQLVNGKYTYFVQAPNGDLQYEYTPYGLRWSKHVHLNGKRVATKSGSDAAATTLSMSNSPANPTFGQAVTVTATVGPSAATGTVEFIEGTQSLGVANVVSGQASVTLSNLTTGAHAIVANYSGDGSYQPASGSRTVTIAKANASITPPSISPPAASLGNSVTLSATVSGTNPTRSVEFKDNGAIIGAPAPLNGGVASRTTGPLSAGTHAFTARYIGDDNHNEATSAVTTLNVAQASPSVGLGSSASISSTGQSVTFTATIGQVATVPATGTVTFRDGATVLGTGNVAGGTATYSTAMLSAGSHTITATYSGDGNYTAGNVPSTTQTVSATSVDGVIANLYITILDRAADAGGKAFWVSEVERLFGLQVDRRESVRVIAKTFFFGAEYAARNRSDSEYLEDLYRAFYQRASDPGGKAFWQGEMNAGLNREAILIAFMFSTEFQNFMNAALGSYTQRPESGLTMDVYRGVYARMPDSGGYNYWRGTVRTGQCNGTTGPASNNLVSVHIAGGEYVGRNRTPKQFIADLYDVMFRRAPDSGGFNWWSGQVQSGAMTRQQVIDAFIGSPEWQNRLSVIHTAGCFQ